MKKLALLLWICLMFVFQSVYSQNINSVKVTYSVEKILPPNYIKRVNDNFGLSEYTRTLLINSYHKTKKVKVFLEFNIMESIYYISNKDKDELDVRGNEGHNLTTPLAGSKNIYYLNLNSDERFYKTKNLGGLYELVYFEKHKWKLINETDKILGYNCKKAIKYSENKKSKTQTVVWYTNEIPFSFGPKDYSGLPGLVLKVEKGNDTFLATKIEINPQELKFQKPTAKLKTTLKEKRKAFQKLMNENK